LELVISNFKGRFMSHSVSIQNSEVRIYLTGMRLLMPNAQEVKSFPNKNTSTDHVPLSDILPEDLESIIGSKGHIFHDDFTKLALYVSRILTVNFPYEANSMGVICATNYGNFKNGIKINEAALSHQKSISAQLFPNATYSSAAVNVSLELGARGINLTLTAGDTGTIAAFALAENYMRDGRIIKCLILAGDDYASFSAKNALGILPAPLKMFSSMGGLTLSTAPQNKDSLELLAAYSARKEQAVFNFLNNKIGFDWEQKYLIHASGTRKIMFESHPPHLIEAYPSSYSLGVGTTLWQINNILNAPDIESLMGIIVFTTSATGDLGVCVLAKPNQIN
jgi:hypothetical protein